MPTAEDIKEMMGFDRNDPNVTVRMVPVSGLSKMTPEKALEAWEGSKLTQDREFVDSSPGPSPGAIPVTADGNGDWTPDPGQTRVEAATAVAQGVLQEVWDEIQNAIAKHDSMKSSHEGYAVILEELDELWDAIKCNQGYTPAARAEAIQVAAMAIRYILDLDPGHGNVGIT